MSLIKRIEELAAHAAGLAERKLGLENDIALVRREATALHDALEAEEKRLLSPIAHEFVSAPSAPAASPFSSAVPKSPVNVDV